MDIDLGDTSTSDANTKKAWRKFQEFKERQRIREEVRKQTAEVAKEWDSYAEDQIKALHAQMPIFGQKKPLDKKKQNKVIKRPVRRQGPAIRADVKGQEQPEEV